MTVEKTLDKIELTFYKRLVTCKDTEDYDFNTLRRFMKIYKEIEGMSARPHLLIIHGNMWEVFHDLKDEVMEYLGYEHVGRMSEDVKDEDETYVFESVDETYDILYRLKDVKIADFTKTLRIEE